MVTVSLQIVMVNLKVSFQEDIIILIYMLKINLQEIDTRCGVNVISINLSAGSVHHH